MDDVKNKGFQLNSMYIGKKIKYYLSSDTLKDSIVHSVFHKVINLHTPYGLLSIVLPEVGKSSSYIVVENMLNLDFYMLGIKSGMGCKLTPKSMEIEDKLTVILGSSMVWEEYINSSFTYFLKDISFDNIAALKAALDRYAAEGSAWKKTFNTREKVFIENFKKLKERNKDQICQAVNNLIGYGPGLTPSGDDVILGFLAAVNHLNEFSLIKEGIKDAVAVNLRRTTDISRSMLSMALEYNYHEYLQILIYSIVRGRPEEVVTSAKQLFKIGSTSGSDIATGVYLGFLADTKVI